MELFPEVSLEEILTKLHGKYRNTFGGTPEGNDGIIETDNARFLGRIQAWFSWMKSWRTFWRYSWRISGEKSERIPERISESQSFNTPVRFPKGIQAKLPREFLGEVYILILIPPIPFVAGGRFRYRTVRFARENIWK